MDIADIVRVFLGAYFTFLAVFYGSKLMAMRHRTGLSHVVSVGEDVPQTVSHGLFRIFRVAIWVLCVARIWWPEIDAWLLPIKPLWIAPILAAGMVCLIGAFAAIVYTHSFMGENWRSGVVPGSMEQLITTGPFERSRNPIFLAVGLAQLGFFLALPSLFTLVCLLVGFAVLSLQARVEEYELREKLGLRYEAYRARTPRWL